jgi:hypothetical protein
MQSIDPKRLQAYRAHTFCLPPAPRINSPNQALDFVNQRGFIFFWPIKGILLPSLWTAVAGDRPVADAHDDPGHITWRWKDEALGRRLWYYAKVLRRKATLISLEIAPYFYALSENYGSPEEDYLLAYEQGHLTLAAKNIYAALLSEGPLDTISLRKAARLSTPAAETEFNRALEQLQAGFAILPIGVASVGAWRYAFIYEIVARHYPDLPERARKIGEAEARQKLIELYFRSLGAAQHKDVNRLFGWPPELVSRALKALVQSNLLVEGVICAGQQGEWLALPELLD